MAAVFKFGTPSALGILAVVLAACAGANSLAPRAPAAAGTVPAHRRAQRARARIVIRIPPHSHRHEKGSGPRFVSPSTKSIEIAIAPAAGCTACTPASTIAADLTPSSPGCSKQSGSTTCTISEVLGAGAYTATIATYDGPVSGGAPTGNELSSNQAVPFSIVAGQNNQIAMTLEGRPASVAFALSGAQPANLNGSAMTIDGASTSVSIAAIAMDADGNAIVGPGSPSVSNVTVSGNTSYVAKSSGSTITLTTPARGSRTPASVQVSVTGPNCPSSACNATFSAAMTEFIAVTDPGATTFQVYSERTQSWIAGQTGLNAENAAFDSKGDLFIADENDNRVLEFAPPYNGAPVVTIASRLAQPISLAFDSKNDLFVANYGGGAVTEYAPPYDALGVTLGGVTTTQHPFRVFVDANDDLWVLNNCCGTGYTGYFSAPIGTSVGTALIDAYECVSIAQDTAGNVDLSCPANGGEIAAYSSGGAYLTHDAIGKQCDYATSLPAGNGVGLILSCGTGSGIENFTAGTWTALDPNVTNGVATDAAGVLYFANYVRGTVETVPYPYAATGTPLGAFVHPYAVVAWP